MKKTLFRLFQYLDSYRIPFVVSVICAAANVLCTLFAPVIIGRAVDCMVKAHAVRFTLLAKTLMTLLTLYLLGDLFLWVLTFLTNRISYKTVNRLRSALSEKLSKLPLSFYDQNPHGDTVSRFVNDVDIISDGILQGFTALLSGIFTIIGSILFMLSINLGMALVVLATAPVTFLAARFITIRSQQLFKKQAKQLGLLSGFAEEMIDGEKVVKSFHREGPTYEHFKKMNDELYQYGVKSQFISSLANPSTRVVNNIAFTFIGAIGCIAVIFGKITVGDISSFLIFSTIFAKPLNDLTNITTQIQSAAASAQRVFQVIDLEPETPDAANALEPVNCRGEVQFKNVCFSYNPGTKLIENFNLVVKPGSSIAIVGHTGAGKTTLVNLLMRFYEVDKGSIQIDGIDIRDMKRDSLRHNFGMVLQDTWLTNASIRDNIAYAVPDAPIEKIISAAKAAGADAFINRLPDGYDTIIRDSGENISQGQKQLLTIARVMLANPPMLILDEATSNIDTYTEIKIQRAFQKLTAGRTSFVIAHRLSTIKNANLILVMDKGRIVESGRHDELLRNSGGYAELYNSQFAGRNI